MKTTITCITSLIIGLFITQSLFSQSYKVPSDSLFKQAQMEAKNRNYDAAEKLCLTLLEQNPNNFDTRLLLANNYMWNKKFEKARPHIDSLLSNKENNPDVLTANINYYLWSDDYAGSLLESNKALSFYPNDATFNLKKAQSLKGLQEYEKAKVVVDTVLAQDPSNKEALRLKQSLFLLTVKNKITLSYEYSFYENDMIPPSHLAYIEYSRKIQKNTYIGRINYGNRFNKGGLQLEADAYIKTAKRAYMYLNLGYSPDNIFPDYRAGAEWYQSFGKGNEASLGLRYLNFAPKHIFIYTGSYGKYWGPWWINARAFVTPKDSDVSLSGLLTVRRYCGSKYTYIGLQLKTGVNPDQRANIIDPVNNYFLNSSAVRLEWSTLFYTRWVTELDLTYENQEYWTNKFRNVLSFEAKLSYLF